MRKHIGIVLAAVLPWALTGLAVSAPTTLPATPTADRGEAASDPQALLRERDGLAVEAARLRQEGKPAEAVASVQRMLRIERRLSGDVSPGVAESLEMLAAMYRSGGDWEPARVAWTEAAAVHEKLEGPGNGPGGWHAADDRRGASDVGTRQAMTKEQLRRLDEADVLAADAAACYGRGDYRGGLAKAERALATRQELLGPEHPDTAVAVNIVGELYRGAGDYAKAEPLLQRSLKIREQGLGPEHPDTATALNNLAGLYRDTGEDAKAEALYVRALKIREKVLGPDHADTATALNNLAGVYKDAGDHAKALPLYQRALAIREKVLGPEDSDTGVALNNLAGLYQDTGDYAQAEPLLQRALQVKEKALGPEHLGTAATLNNLALLCHDTGDYARAQPLYERALAIREKVVGPDHPDTAITLSNLAELYHDAGNYSKAQPLYERALAIREKALGPEHPDTAAAVNNLAGLFQDTGDYAKAEPLYQRALAVREKALGPDHPNSAAALSNLATLRLCTGKSAEAAELFARAADAAARQAELTASVQSERQQLAFAATLRGRLDGYLSSASSARAAQDSGSPAAPTDPVYERVLRWKGAVSARQQAMRAARRAAAHAPESARRFVELERAARELANLSAATPDPAEAPAYRRRVEELSDTVERLQAGLADTAGHDGDAVTFKRVTAEDVRQALPAGAVLVDVLEYGRTMPPPARKGPMLYERRLTAFVVRRDRPVAWVELGPVEPVEAAVHAWRQTLGSGESARTAGAELRRLVWEPLKEQVKGAEVVLVSPDGPLCRMPPTALPGEKPGTYLIEEVAVATVAVPSLLPRMLAGPADREAGGAAASTSLLVVGDVDYNADPGGPEATSGQAVAAADASPGRSAARGAGQQWARLEATHEEAAGVRDWFETRFPDGKVKSLRRGQATESTLRAEMPGHRYVHLATHGFFADPARHSALGTDAGPAGPATLPAAVSPGPRGGSGRDVRGFHPGLLSGLVLSGANRPPDPQGARDDGILTALEVQELDLSAVDVAVLSACETGLGRSAGGEGLLGLQRAFQVAGARTVVASLWQVPDQATQALMARFYQNLWEKKMTRLESLRQAQLWLLREGASRGMVRDREPAATGPGPARGDGDRLPPSVWAAFMLSGDWR